MDKHYGCDKDRKTVLAKSTCMTFVGRARTSMSAVSCPQGRFSHTGFFAVFVRAQNDIWAVMTIVVVLKFTTGNI